MSATGSGRKELGRTWDSKGKLKEGASKQVLLNDLNLVGHVPEWNYHGLCY